MNGVRRTTLAARLKAIYGSVDKVDAFVGMVSEPHVPRHRVRPASADDLGEAVRGAARRRPLLLRRRPDPGPRLAAVPRRLPHDAVAARPRRHRRADPGTGLQGRDGDACAGPRCSGPGRERGTGGGSDDDGRVDVDQRGAALIVVVEQQTTTTTTTTAGEPSTATPGVSNAVGTPGRGRPSAPTTLIARRASDWANGWRVAPARIRRRIGCERPGPCGTVWVRTLVCSKGQIRTAGGRSPCG